MSLFTSMITLAGIWFFVVTIPGPNFLMVSRFSISDSRKRDDHLYFIALVRFGCLFFFFSEGAVSVSPIEADS